MTLSQTLMRRRKLAGVHNSSSSSVLTLIPRDRANCSIVSISAQRTNHCRARFMNLAPAPWPGLGSFFLSYAHTCNIYAFSILYLDLSVLETTIYNTYNLQSCSEKKGMGMRRIPAIQFIVTKHSTDPKQLVKCSFS